MRRLLTFVLFALASAAPSSAGLLYSVLLDTSSLNGTAAYVDFQYNGFGAQPGTATISNFLPQTLSGSPFITGNVTGDLTSTVDIDNQGSFNDYFHSLTLGNFLSFLVTFNGPNVTAPSSSFGASSSFSFSLYASDQTTPLLSNDPSGFLLIADLFAGASSLATTNLSATDSFGNPLLSAGQVPEPATYALVGLGLAAVAYIRRRKSS